jgi:hypothetical protein
MNYQKTDSVSGDSQRPGAQERENVAVGDPHRMESKKPAERPTLGAMEYQETGGDQGEGIVKRDFGQAYSAASDVQREIDNESLKKQQAERALGKNPEFHLAKTPSDDAKTAEMQIKEKEKGKSA